jgi:DNA polymerase-3 subunit delta'
MEMSAGLTGADVPLPWQEETWRALAARLTQGQLPHGLLITGQAGLGKALLAGAFAQLLLCRAPVQGRACGSCAGCAQFLADTHPDFNRVELEEREGKAGEEGALKSAISVEQIRELVARLQLRSQHRGRKLALIEPAELMSTAAANSLLKTLEEPPADTVLLLVSAHPGRMPATVRSRCQRLAMAAPTDAAALRWLSARTDRDDWPLLLGLTGGAPLAALALAESDFAAERRAFLEGLMKLRRGQAHPQSLTSQPKDSYALLLRFLWSVVTDLIRLQGAGRDAALINRDQLPLLQMASEGLNLRRLYGYLDRVQAAIQALDTPLNRELAFTVLLADWADGLEEYKHAPLAARGNWGST